MVSSTEILKEFLAKCVTELASEKAARFIPVIDSFVAGTISFACSYGFLRQCLKTMIKKCNFSPGRDFT